MSSKKLIVDCENVKRRLDVYLVQNLNNLSRSYIQKLINEGYIKVNNRTEKPNYKLKLGDKIKIEFPQPKELSVKPENIKLDVLYEDDEVIVINKPKGMVVHPAPGNYTSTMVNALLAHCENLSGINGMIRPGIVHRLDKDTSGVIMAAKTDKAHKDLARQIKERTVKRRYVALVHGIIKEDKGCIDAPIGRHPVNRKKMAVTHKNSKRAVTHFKVVERFDDYTLIEASLETGRTHQIRVHMAYIGHPLVGDTVYGLKRNNLGFKGQALHAKSLGFKHPKTGQYLEFTAPIPVDFKNVIEKLRVKKGGR